MCRKNEALIAAQLSRRHFVAIATAAAAIGMGATDAAASNSNAAVRFMKRVVADLMAAQRDGRVVAYYRVISRRADLPAIALYSLGRYRSKLPHSKRRAFYHGVGAFMARYFAGQSKDYRVVKADFTDSPRRDGDTTLVDSTLTLASGSTYHVVWRLVHHQSGFRISDVRVLGFSLVYLQKRLFQSYIWEKGSLEALVSALTR